MERFTKALEIVARVMAEGAVTHPDNDWVGRSPDYHIGRAEEHLRLWRDGDQLEDHMSHAATRLLMALTLREVDVIREYRRNRPRRFIKQRGVMHRCR
jgi:dATP/dGTP diphosphohydrolase